MLSDSSIRRATEPRERSLWVRADIPRSWRTRKAIIEAAAAAKVELVVVRPEDLAKARQIGPKALGLFDQGQTTGKEGLVQIDTRPSKEKGSPSAAALLTINSGPDQELAMDIAGSYGVVIAHCRDWRVIPLENIVAAFQGKGSRVFATASGPEDAVLALGILERGVDGILLEATRADDVHATALVVHSKVPSLSMSKVEVLSVRPVGMGDRACVDTCSILESGEGLLVGNQASGLVLVLAETQASEYVPPRPFRVNAGAIHSYVLDAGNKTRYLSDLRAGDPALIVRIDGSVRLATVGRVKIETRPLLMVELRHGDQSFKAALQDAETIRVAGQDGKPISVKELKSGDEILAYLSGQARHFGMAVEERLIER